MAQYSYNQLGGSPGSKDLQGGYPGRKKKTLDDYEFLLNENARGPTSLLGKGSYGSVKKVKDKQTGETYAMKIMSKKSIFEYSSKENLKREITIQRSIFHPNIIRLYNHFEDEENVYLVLEFAENGSLFHHLRRKQKFPEAQAFLFFLQTCLGIDYLHKRKIIHRDLKPENLLLDKNSNIKLCDFGWSAENFTIRHTYCGTIDYMAPEMVKNQPYDHTLDIWCLGVLLYELLHGYAPFKGSNDREKQNNIAKNQSISFNPDLSPEAVDLIQKILRPNPKERLSMNQIFNHPWMKKLERAYNVSIQGYVDQQDNFIRETQVYGPKLDVGRDGTFYGSSSSEAVPERPSYTANPMPEASPYNYTGSTPGYDPSPKPYSNPFNDKGQTGYSGYGDTSTNYLSSGYKPSDSYGYSGNNNYSNKYSSLDDPYKPQYDSYDKVKVYGADPLNRRQQSEREKQSRNPAYDDLKGRLVGKGYVDDDGYDGPRKKKKPQMRRRKSEVRKKLSYPECNLIAKLFPKTTDLTWMHLKREERERFRMIDLNILLY